MPVLLGLLVREAGKSVPNAIGEVREAIDFLRYYAQQARSTFGPDQQPLGVVACISPWNFPLAIFTGQIAAALVAGNAVLAKPAEETPLIAAQAVALLHEAGVPADALQLLPGDGQIGSALVSAPETEGVMFTGSSAVARLIQRQLATRLSSSGSPIPLVAETGGQNAMIVDSSALAQQVVADVISSAFDSAGQRCSALRVLCLQEDVADRMLAMLKGAIMELRIGRPDALNVDVGPVITRDAKAMLEKHVAEMKRGGAHVEQLPLPASTVNGTFVAPTIIKISDIAQLQREVFGPVLHVIRYRREQVDALVDAINATGYGLTFGIHTRLDETIDRLAPRIKVGNIYVNRNMIGAIVGVQPFGGRGLSGTGPKAGGPLYLGRLVKKAPTAKVPVRPGRSLLTDFADWLDASGHRESSMIARRYGEASLLGIEHILPGPVGERNIYALHPRGQILMVSSTPAGLIEQMAAVLATGNKGSVAGMPLPTGMPASVAACFSIVPGTEPFAAALVEGDMAAVSKLLGDVAALPGPVISVHAARSAPDMAYDCNFLLDEVSTSINTTAAGGNASLVMIQ
jgi:RHH-type proline utilization regulon transcriptional repressor/proline dehydrogenase/delta 1-pyrroline-5-carboxylate dehydrogenase